MLIEVNQRKISRNNFYPKDDLWWIEYDEDANEYNIVFSYDCGYAEDHIDNINFCPLCGRELY